MTESIEYKKGYKYQLYKTYFVQTDIHPPENIHTELIDLTAGGLLTIRKHYAWDGPSGPTIDTPSFMRPSLIHDALYQLIRMGLLSIAFREAVDRELKKDCKEDGMCSWYRSIVYWAVRKFAKSSALKENMRKVITAPKRKEIE